MKPYNHPPTLKLRQGTRLYDHKAIESKWPSSAKVSEGQAGGYDHKAIETKWQEVWEETKLNQPDLKRAKNPFYNLMMYPYPSAEGLHVGNMYAFTGADIYGRFQRMQGFQVFEPIGFDSGGIHSENFAIKKKVHPKVMTERNVKNFTNQLHKIGAMYDWEHTVDAMDPAYYRWTQWIFIQLFKKGLAYKKEAPVTWCPSCKTTVSDEQTEKKGEATVCERCKTPIEKRKMKQWFFKITAYAERLLENTKKLNWSEKVLIAQRNWIGKSEGINIEYKVAGTKEKVICFTTRPDTNFGATFIVLAPEHSLVDQITTKENKKTVSKYVKQALAKSEMERIAEGREKTGAFTGAYAVNNLNGQKMPIWISDFVLGHVGTGAVVGVPGHDIRDFEFAQKFNIPVKRVVVRNPDRCRSYLMGAESMSNQELQAIGIDTVKQAGDARQLEFDVKNLPAYQKLIREKLSPGYWNEVIGKEVWFCFKDKAGKVTEYVLSDENMPEIAQKCSQFNNDSFEKTSNLWLYLAENEWYRPFIIQEEEGVMVNSDFLNGLDIHEATEKIMDYLETKEWGKRTVTYKLRDWCISRQRYWGPPIPMVYCPSCARKGKGWFSKRVRPSRGTDPNLMAGWYPVPEEDLPVKLPEIDNYLPDGSGKAPLAKHPEFYETKCPKCGGKATRETDVSDTFLDSSWYFLAYPNRGTKEFESPRISSRSAGWRSGDLIGKEIISASSSYMVRETRNDKPVPFNIQLTQKWLPVDQYTGGAEHSVLHLMYSRFITMALHDMGYLDFEEPFPNFYAHGLIIKDGAKMSKSRGNVVNPDEYIEKYGADALRMYLMFIGPFNQGGNFQDTGMRGMYRFVKKIYGLAMKTVKNKVSRKDPVIWRELERTTQKMAKDFSRFKYNTAIARLMEFVNVWSDLIDKSGPKVAERIAILLAPLAPHLAEEIWAEANGLSTTDYSEVRKGQAVVSRHLTVDQRWSVHQQSWPEVDQEKIKDKSMIVIVQVNGKKRGEVQIKRQVASSKQQVVALASKVKRVQNYLKDKQIKKTIFVPGKLVNFVVS